MLWLRRLGWTLAGLVGVAVLLALAVWAYGPYWLAPVEDFAQGPGGAVAYVSLYQQLNRQGGQFWAGGDLTIVMNQEEFSGMVSSALLSGRRPENPIRKVRTTLIDGEIRVETILQLPYEQVPERYRGPIGLKLRLRPAVAQNGVVQFQISRATVGRIPIPTALIRWAGRAFPINAPGFNAQDPSISLPVSDAIASHFGRQVRIKQFSANGGQMSMVIAMQQQKSK